MSNILTEDMPNRMPENIPDKLPDKCRKIWNDRIYVYIIIYGIYVR